MSRATPLPDTGKPVSSVVFREVAARYLAHNALYAENPSIHAYQFRVFVKALGDLPFDAIGREQIEGFFAERRAAGIRATTCNRNRSCLLVFYRWAEERGLCSGNPMRLIRKFRERPRQGITLTPTEFNALVMASAAHLKAYLLALRWTGGRRTETVRILWRWFNPEARAITFVSENTKGKRSRTVPVPSALYKALVALPRGAPDDRIFLYRGRPIESMRTALRTACKRAGVPPIGWHVLRRTFATLANDNGIPTQMLQRLLGHASITTTERYIRPGPRFLEAAASYIEPERGRGAGEGEE